jgi:hypothetical protein
MLKRDFLTGEELGAFELGRLLDEALELKAGRRSRGSAGALDGRSIGLVFERPSTRTRISFEVGVAELGATADRPPWRRTAALARRVDRRHRARPLPLSRRDRDPLRLPRERRRARRRGRGAGRQRADSAPPPLPGARRPDDDARALRRPRRPCASPTSATATTSPARWRSPASSPASSSSAQPRPATSSSRDTGRS